MGLPDREIWQLVTYIRDLPNVRRWLAAQPARSDTKAPRRRDYAGSAACKTCHEEVYARWSKTRMANVVRDPREHPDAIIPDLSKPDPLLTFTKDDIALVYGSRWKQRYFKKVGDDYFPLPAQWDVSHQIWRHYFVPNGTDWWATLYPPDNFQRPTGPLCDGCHSVNYDINTKTITEWNVGCERCHGPGRRMSSVRRAKHPQSGPLRLRARQRHLHPVPFAGPASDQPDPGQILRLAGRL